MRPIARSLRGGGGAATIRLKPSENVPTAARLALEPRGDCAVCQHKGGEGLEPVINFVPLFVLG